MYYSTSTNSAPKSILVRHKDSIKRRNNDAADR